MGFVPAGQRTPPAASLPGSMSAEAPVWASSQHIVWALQVLPPHCDDAGAAPTHHGRCAGRSPRAAQVRAHVQLPVYIVQCLKLAVDSVSLPLWPAQSTCHLCMPDVHMQAQALNSLVARSWAGQTSKSASLCFLSCRLPKWPALHAQCAGHPACCSMLAVCPPLDTATPPPCPPHGRMQRHLACINFQPLPCIITHLHASVLDSFADQSALPEQADAWKGRKICLHTLQGGVSQPAPHM